MAFPLLATAAVAAVGYIAWRKSKEPDWNPFRNQLGGENGNVLNSGLGGGGSHDLITVPESALYTPGGGYYPSQAGAATSNLGVLPATPTPVNGLGTTNAAAWRPAFMLPIGADHSSDAADMAAHRDSLPEGSWETFAQSLQIAAAVVNPGIMGAVTLGSTIVNGTPLSLSGIIGRGFNSVFGGAPTDSDSEVNLGAFDPLSASLEAGEFGNYGGVEGEGSGEADAPAASPRDGVETGAGDYGGYDGGGYDGGGGWDGGGSGDAGGGDF